MEQDGRTRVFLATQRENPTVIEEHPNLTWTAELLGGAKAQEVIDRTDVHAETPYGGSGWKITGVRKGLRGIGANDFISAIDGKLSHTPEMVGHLAATLEQRLGTTGLTVLVRHTQG